MLTPRWRRVDSKYQFRAIYGSLAIHRDTRSVTAQTRLWHKMARFGRHTSGIESHERFGFECCIARGDAVDVNNRVAARGRCTRTRSSGSRRGARAPRSPRSGRHQNGFVPEEASQRAAMQRGRRHRRDEYKIARVHGRARPRQRGSLPSCDSRSAWRCKSRSPSGRPKRQAPPSREGGKWPSTRCASPTVGSCRRGHRQPTPAQVVFTPWLASRSLWGRATSDLE